MKRKERRGSALVARAVDQLHVGATQEVRTHDRQADAVLAAARCSSCGSERALVGRRELRQQAVVQIERGGLRRALRSAPNTRIE